MDYDLKKIQIESLTEALRRAKEIVRLIEQALTDLGAPTSARSGTTNDPDSD